MHVVSLLRNCSLASNSAALLLTMSSILGLTQELRFLLTDCEQASKLQSSVSHFRHGWCFSFVKQQDVSSSSYWQFPKPCATVMFVFSATARFVVSFEWCGAAASATSLPSVLLHQCSCGVCVLIQIVCCCDFSNDISFRSLQNCRRLSHFRLLCDSVSFDFILHFSFEFSVALFGYVRFVRSTFFHRLDSLCSLLLGFSSRCVFFLWDFFLRYCNLKLSHDTSVVESHVDHVNYFRISAVTDVFSVCQNVVQLLVHILLSRCEFYDLLSLQFFS